MTANERRRKIIDVLSVRRYDKVMNLANEFEVCRRTILNDIYALSLSYPIFMNRGTGGGVFVMDGAKLYIEGRFNPRQSELLQRLAKALTGKDAEIMKGILLKFGKPEKE